MKLISYMLKKFAGIFLGSLFFFVLILCLTDLLMNLWNYISHNVQFATVMKIIWYYVPKTIWYAVPIAMLFATAYMLSDLYARNELLAVFASGISLLRFTAPLLLVGVAMSFGLFFFEDNLVTGTYSKKMEMQHAALNQNQSLNRENIVVMADHGKIIYYADYYDDDLKRLYSLYVLLRDEERNFDSMIYTDNAIWEKDAWNLGSARMYVLKDGFMERVAPDSERLSLLTEPPETFQNSNLSVEEMNTRDARDYIAHLERAGLPAAEAKSVYYKKFAFPFVVFIVVFLAVGLSGKTRKNVLLISLALSIGAVVLFYVMQMITMLMAKFEVIPPLFGAWFPVFFFIFVSIILLHFART